MMDTLSPDQIPMLLQRVGEILQDGGKELGIVIVGGAALNLLGVIRRTTVDVDVIALARSTRAGGRPILIEPRGLPAELAEAAARVARDFGLPPRWVNTDVASQWRTGLPPGLVERVEWRRYGGLNVGIPGRPDLIALKLHAAVDNDPQSRHVQDLVALRPSREELNTAGNWVRAQDAGAGFSRIVDQVIDHVAARTP
jgi:hypothetical protein